MMCARLATRRDGFQFPCGQCTNCRINHRRNWVARLLLEAATNAYSAFVTLTFQDTGTPPILRRSDIKYFLRHIRHACPETRHFSIGEYGTRTGRAHYHTHLFTQSRPLTVCDLQKAWPFGHVYLGSTEADSIQYVFGYLFKDPKLSWPVEGRYPEFRSFSPGIGRAAFDELSTAGYLPREFTVLGESWPIGRYFRNMAKRHGLVIDDTKQTKLANLETQYVRSLLSDPSLTEEQVGQVYEEARSRQVEKTKLLQQRAIRDAYRQNHGHNRSKRNETF